MGIPLSFLFEVRSIYEGFFIQIWRRFQFLGELFFGPIVFKGISNIKLKAGSQFFISSCLFIFKGNSVLKLKMIFSSLPVTLQAPFGIQCYNFGRGRQPKLMGWTDGRMDGHQKGPLIFFILTYVLKHFKYILYKKIVPTNFLQV